MSTSINVTIGGSGLPDKAKQQTQSNRFQKLEADAKANAEKQAKAQREQKLKAEGKGPDGKPLANTPLQYDPRVDELAAFRNVNLGMSCAWLFNRLKEQPTISRTESSASWPNGIGFYTAESQLYKLYSGSGASSYEFSEGYDHTYLWGQTAAAGPSVGGSGSVPYAPARFCIGPSTDVSINGESYRSFGNTSSHSVSIMLPIAKGLMLWYRYNKLQKAYQFITNQWWSNGEQSVYNLEDPFVISQVFENCLLVSQNSIKQLPSEQIPSTFRDLLLASITTYTFILRNRTFYGDYMRYYNGQNLYLNPVTAPGFGWQINYPTNTIGLDSPYDISSMRYQKYTLPLTYFPWPTGPGLASNGLGTSHVISTGGIYRNIVRDPDFDYGSYYDKAPQITAKLTAGGFNSGQSWGEVYDNATILEHSSSKSAANNLVMATDRLPRPVDTLNYLTRSGTTAEANWFTQIFIGYDWANARYCRDQLMKLGFTASDLTP